MPASPDLSPGQEISRELSALWKRYFGKGPRHARTHVVDDLVVAVLYGGYTAIEDTLRDSGRGDAVSAQREAFQDAMRARFVAVVEQATGRTVDAFMSTNHRTPDLALEIFHLAPADGARDDASA